MSLLQRDFLIDRNFLSIMDEMETRIRKLEERVQVVGDLSSSGWVNYSNLSTLTGWSGTPSTLSIYLIKIGSLVFVTFNISGTSNSTATSFTLPYACNPDVGLRFAMTGQDNGTWGFRVGRMAVSTATVDFYTDAASTAWTATGSKQVLGEFFYHTA